MPLSFVCLQMQMCSPGMTSSLFKNMCLNSLEDSASEETSICAFLSVSNEILVTKQVSCNKTSGATDCLMHHHSEANGDRSIVFGAQVLLNISECYRVNSVPFAKLSLIAKQSNQLEYDLFL